VQLSVSSIFAIIRCLKLIVDRRRFGTSYGPIFTSQISSKNSGPLKYLRKFSVQPGLRCSNDLHVGRKIATFQFFSGERTGGCPKGPDSENRVDDQVTGSPGSPVTSGMHVPGVTGYCRARTRLP